MKHINKSSIEPKSLSDWKAQDKMYKGQNAKWKRFGKDKSGRNYKKEFTIDLIKEQGSICCYCERELKIDDCHLEHFIPQKLDHFSLYLFDYHNLLCSCQLELGKGEPRHCGNGKGSWYDKELLISPLDSTCEEKFKYFEDGYIESTDDASLETIKRLKLGIDKLNDLRRKAIEPFLFFESGEMLSEEESKIFAKGYLNSNNGKFNEFYTTIKYLFE